MPSFNYYKSDMGFLVQDFNPASLGQLLENKLLMLDRDDTIIYDPRENLFPFEVKFTSEFKTIIPFLNKHAPSIVIITNQSRIAKGIFSVETVLDFHQTLALRLNEVGIRLNSVLICPHSAGPNGELKCRCRKPNTALLEFAMLQHGNISNGSAMFIGNSITDEGAAKKLDMPYLDILNPDIIKKLENWIDR